MKPRVRSYSNPYKPGIRIQNGSCDVCGKGRGHGNHDKCSKIRKAFYDQQRASHEQGKDLLVPRPDAAAHQ